MASADDQSSAQRPHQRTGKAEITTGTDLITRQLLTPKIAIQESEVCSSPNSLHVKEDSIAVLTKPTPRGNSGEPTAVPDILPDMADPRDFPPSDNGSDTKSCDMEISSASSSDASESADSPSAYSICPPVADPPNEIQPRADSGECEESVSAQSHKVGLDAHLTCPPPAQQSYEPQYSPPNSSAVSSTLVSPVIASFDRPRHHHSSSFGVADAEKAYPLDTVSDFSEGADDYSGITISRCSSMRTSDIEDNEGEQGYYGEGYLGECNTDGSIIHPGTRDDSSFGCDSTDHSSNRAYAETDDADDVMNPSDNCGGGIVIPHIHGGLSIDKQELEQVTSYAPKGLDSSQADGITDPFSPTYSTIRRASSPTGQPEPLFTSHRHMRDSSATHIRFDPDVAVRDTRETPFAKTMKHFKQFKGKENTPSKSRRNASLPDEIAELAKAAQQDGIENEQEMWKAYREIDFAPEDPVMDAGLAGDLIMAGTPTKQHITAPLKYVKSVTPTLNDGQVSRTPIGDAGTIYEVSIPGHYDDAFRLRFRSKSSIQHIASCIRKRGEELEANEKDLDHVVKLFITCPEDFVIDEEPRFLLSDCSPTGGEYDSQVNKIPPSDPDEDIPVPPAQTQSLGSDHGVNHDEYDKQLVLYQDDPVFVRVIGMLPQAMFWVVAQPIAHYSNKAFDAIMYKLAGVTLDGPEATA